MEKAAVLSITSFLPSPSGRCSLSSITNLTQNSVWGVWGGLDFRLGPPPASPMGAACLVTAKQEGKKKPPTQEGKIIKPRGREKPTQLGLS